MEKVDYQVVFDGTLTGEFSPADTRTRFQKIFRLNPDKLERLFSGNRCIVKKSIDENTAMEFAIRIAEAGGECYIEPMQTSDPVENEQRNRDERRMRYRRDPRPGAIVPDRRRGIRRQEDLEYFEELILNDSVIPLALRSYPRIKPS